MYLNETYAKKWAPVLDHPELPKISDPYKRAVTALVLENQERALVEESRTMTNLWEASPANAVGGGMSPVVGSEGGIKGFDPILIGLVRRALPNLMAYDLCGVQPMTGPTGLIFAMRSVYASSSARGGEALFLEANTAHSYTLELAQDLKAIHGLDAETELTNILSTEILAEINREVVRTIYATANVGITSAAQNVVNLSSSTLTDAAGGTSGRWQVEKYKSLLFRIEQAANKIAKDTRRGKGNLIIVSTDVASALAMTGLLDYNSALSNNTNLTVDDKMLTTLACSTAHTSHSRWFAQSTQQPTSQRLASRPVMVSLQILSQQALALVH